MPTGMVQPMPFVQKRPKAWMNTFWMLPEREGVGSGLFEKEKIQKLRLQGEKDQ
jgi:hypothetical protein